MKAILMAGGQGTRLRPVTGPLPKPMVPLLGRPLMEHILLLLRQHGFTEICAAHRYRAEDIQGYFG
ncbi:MAG: NTP transferase domain-containing protein, partial [Oscillospiraceae bacterium]|nr:NTP transferase domain-containing protein [Oscillospiraceae bacterium]